MLERGARVPRFTPNLLHGRCLQAVFKPVGISSPHEGVVLKKLVGGLDFPNDLICLSSWPEDGIVEFYVGCSLGFENNREEMEDCR